MNLQHERLIKKSKQVKEIPYDEIWVGKKAITTKEITNKDILDFADLTQDVNPIHIDEEFASGTRFKGRIAHGMLTAGFISTLIGTLLPGKNAVYLSQYCKFTAPVRVGDTISVTGEVVDLQPDKKIATIQTNIYNQNNELVIEGSAVVMKLE